MGDPPPTGRHARHETPPRVHRRENRNDHEPRAPVAPDRQILADQLANATPTQMEFVEEWMNAELESRERLQTTPGS